MAQKEWSLAECLERVRSRMVTQTAGFYGPRSAMWLIMRENMVPLGAISAVLLQVAHPAIAAAGAHSSRVRSDFNGRTRRTFAAVYEIIFGDTATASLTIERIHRIHNRVRRESGEQPYRASDPDLLFWVLATLIDCSVRTYELLVGPLSLRDREDYYADMRLFGTAMGIPPDFMPPTWAGFEQYWEAMVNGDRLRIGETGSKLARFILGSAGARWSGSAALVAGMLPERWRKAYGVAWGPKEQRRFAWTIRAMRLVHQFMPASLRYCPAYHQALVRLAAAPRESKTLLACAIGWTSRLLRLPWVLAPAQDHSSVRV